LIFVFTAPCGRANVTDSGFLTNDESNADTQSSLFIKYLCAKDFTMDKRKAADSLIVMTELVLPNDTNTFGNLMGGRLMYWMDIAAALSAMKHCGAPVVTASVDNISFEAPIKLGNVVHIEAKVSRAFNTSMEVHLKVWGENALQQKKYKSNEAYYTFVSLDSNGKPQNVPQLVAETDEEKKLFDSALRRRQVRLILGGKMKPDEATELKALFVKE
jgi:acyl-CoA hydrolase